MTTNGGSLPLLPTGLVPYGTQVAGHKFGCKTNKDVYGFLDTGKGVILKPVTMRKGAREVHFYELVNGTLTSDKFYAKDLAEAEDIKRLRSFIPPYFGVVTFPEHPGVTYCRVMDVTSIYHLPCVTDVKIGRVTWGPDADVEKAQAESKKYPWVEETCFQLLGFRVFNKAQQKYETYERSYCRSLDPAALIRDGLAKFFGWSWGPRRDVIASVIAQIDSIEAWFKRQRHLQFYGSSFLIVYDANTPPTAPSTTDPLSLNRLSITPENDVELTNSTSSAASDNIKSPAAVISASTSESNNNSGSVTSSKTAHGGNVPKSVKDPKLRSETGGEDGIKGGFSLSIDDVIAEGVSPSPWKQELEYLRGNPPPVAVCKMIDFAHIWPSNGQRDDNYLDSTAKLKKYLSLVNALPAPIRSNSVPAFLAPTPPSLMSSVSVPHDVLGASKHGATTAAATVE